MKTLPRMAVTFFGLILLYLLLLLAAYAIPNDWIADNVDSAFDVIETEGAYPHYFFDYPFGQTDNNTDKEMYLNLLTDDDTSVLAAAMVPRYSRYWHGYAVLLRPLSVLLSIANIRYLNMVVIMGLLCIGFQRVSQRINMPAAVAFLLGLVATYIWLAPFNMQYFTVTALTLLFSCIVLTPRRRGRPRCFPVLFLCFGSLTNFFDYLTFPILTLGYPLILLLLLRKSNEDRTFATELKFLLMYAASWCAGYALTLLAKGVLGTLFIGTDVLDEIVENAVYRIGGTLPEGYKTGTSLWMALRYNIAAFFNMRNLLLLILSLLVLAVMAYRRRGACKGWAASLPILGVTAFPYVWYAVLQNHSIVHCYFTFKAQAVAFFGLCAYLIAVVDFSRRPAKGIRHQ